MPRMMHGVFCNNCKSEWLQSLGWETGYGIAEHKCHCPECGAAWIDTYDWCSREDYLIQPGDLPPHEEEEESQ